MYEWRADTKWRTFEAHIDRWDKALLAFGETVDNTTLDPMTDSEAQGFADKDGWERWFSVAKALHEVETGSSDANFLEGASGADLLVGLGGADTLSGQGGNDELRGGGDDDTYTGGAGADRFVFFIGETGAKTFTDFEAGDVIVLKQDTWLSATAIIASEKSAGEGKYVYTLADGLTVETDARLKVSDFVVE